MEARRPRATLRCAFAGAAAAVVAFAALTWLALESGDVVVLRTFDASGAPVDSRVWIADDETGQAWIEAAEPEKPFYLRLLARPEVELLRGLETVKARAVPMPGDEGHARIRSMLRAKYGWRDRWIGLLVDTSRSVAVRLEPIESSIRCLGTID